MSFANIAVIFDLLHAVVSCSPMIATEYDACGRYTTGQIMRGFSVLHQHELTMSELILDETGYRILDYKQQGLTEKGRRIYQVLLQTQVAFDDADIIARRDAV
jgi:hypothetical protein